jgi:Holliday junction resolvase RusA-like endonuclease
MILEFRIPGNPVPQKRHRTVRRGKFTHSYDPSALHKREIESMLRTQCGQKCPYFGPDQAISCHLIFYLPIAKSTSKKVKEARLSGAEQAVHSPDLDNCIKLICDAMNEICYVDDRQIVSITAVKMYSDDPHTKIKLVLVP